MKLLVVKTSSLGDVIHTLPAITDAAARIPGLQVHWVVEESFREIPAWHPAVSTVIAVALRRWRRDWRQAWRSQEPQGFIRQLRANTYDRIIDAQGLIKSAAIARLARGERCGLDRSSAREPLAALAYGQRFAVPRPLHAIERVRRLFAHCLDYDYPGGAVDYGIVRPHVPVPEVNAQPYLVFLHGTTWPTKQWPAQYWTALLSLAADAGYTVYLPWAGDAEKQFASELAACSANAHLLPPLELSPLAWLLGGAAGVVGVDTGLAHLAAALGVPSVTLYGATRPQLTGTQGRFQRHLQSDFPCAPCLRRKCTHTETSEVFPACYARLPAQQVWAGLQAAMAEKAA